MNMGSILVLTGGVGGSKLAEGLAQVLSPESLLIVVNTADDFRHLGLAICPDLDSVTYMLAGLSHDERGWGRNDETWSCMNTMGDLGGENWFQLGDRDLALHLHRTNLLRQGISLNEVTRRISAHLGIAHRIVPMTEQPVSTVIQAEQEDFAFQDYFVRHRCEPVAIGYRYEGIDKAAASPDFLAALRSPNLEGIIFAPSNPILSIGPILSIPGIREAIVDSGVPVLAVSPLIAGKAVKGPAAKLMRELGYGPQVDGVTTFYDGLLDYFVMDTQDAEFACPPGIHCLATDILMNHSLDRRRLAHFCIDTLMGCHSGNPLSSGAK